MASFRLEFPITEVEALAASYDVDVDDEVAAAGRVALNTDAFVERITGAAFATGDEAERMAALCVLRGVDTPSASVLLHFAFPDRYPIIDWRALESLGQQAAPPYSIRYWLAYADACRELAEQAGVSLRVLDKALWQHSRDRPR